MKSIVKVASLSILLVSAGLTFAQDNEQVILQMQSKPHQKFLNACDGSKVGDYCSFKTGVNRRTVVGECAEREGWIYCRSEQMKRREMAAASGDLKETDPNQ